MRTENITNCLEGVELPKRFANTSGNVEFKCSKRLWDGKRGGVASVRMHWIQNTDGIRHNLCQARCERNLQFLKLQRTKKLFDNDNAS